MVVGHWTSCWAPRRRAGPHGAAMIFAGYVVTGLGLAVYAVGVGYWLSFAFHRNRFRILRRQSPWDLLGGLSAVGLLLFGLGRTLVATGRRMGR